MPLALQGNGSVDPAFTHGLETVLSETIQNDLNFIKDFSHHFFPFCVKSENQIVRHC